MEYIITDRLGQEVKIGDEVVDFRGDKGTLQGVTRGPAPGKTAKVVVDGREGYATVWDLTVTPKL